MGQSIWKHLMYWAKSFVLLIELILKFFKNSIAIYFFWLKKIKRNPLPSIVWCIKNRTKHSNVLVLCLVRFLMHQTLGARHKKFCQFWAKKDFLKDFIKEIVCNLLIPTLQYLKKGWPCNYKKQPQNALTQECCFCQDEIALSYNSTRFIKEVRSLDR